MRLHQPRGWESRADRLYRRAAQDLARVAGPAAPTPERQGEPDDGGRDARRALGRARDPYRALGAGLAVIGAALAAAALLIVLLASVLSTTARARLFPRDLARRRPWTASSAEVGYPMKGNRPSSDGPFFFHTTFSDHPWVEIDLGAEHVIRSLQIENRKDCCQERALPMNVEIFDGRVWKLIAQRRSPFSVWDYDVDPVRARLVRVRLAGAGLLHLRRVALYGR